MGYEKYILKTDAFTLTDIILVIIIVSVLALLAFPRYTMTLEKARVGEGLQILEALYKAQRAFSFENGNFTNNLNLLDVTIPAADYFNPPTVGAGPVADIATVTRTGSYTLSVDANGLITCAGGLPAVCNQIGCQGAGNSCN